jgi:subtilisin-like proprotein convertase family protein
VKVNIFNRDLGFSGALCTQVELVSPAGTRSILLNAANGFKNSILEDVLLSSNAFYGENPNGTWRLLAYDWCSSTPVTPTMFSLSKSQAFAFTGY